MASSIEVKGDLLDSYEGIEIYGGFPFNQYVFKGYPFSKDENTLFEALSAFLSRKLSLGKLKDSIPFSKKEAFITGVQTKVAQSIEAEQLMNALPSEEQLSNMETRLKELLAKLMPPGENVERLAEAALDHSLGFAEISPLLRDVNLEEIMVNAVKKPVFVFHKKYGMCKTNIILPSQESFRLMISRIAKHSGKVFDEENPLLDARLPDGSRVNATLATVTPSGSSMTVRKFTKIPLSIVDLLEKKTLSLELASFLWLMVEGLKVEPMNMIVTGGTGSGKTTLLNVLSTFVRHSDRLLSIEDTLELDLGSRENWIQMEAKPSIHGSPAVTMDDLLKNSLRMRPDRIIVGEVRGPEAQTLFTAMDTGHKGLLGTMHSNSAREMLLRFKSSPMSVPNSMLPLLDLSIVMFKMYDRDLGIIRRVKEVAELSRMEEKVLLSTIFEWEKKNDGIKQTDVPSHLFDHLAEKSNMSKTQLRSEQLVRQRILQWLVENKIRENPEVEKVIQQYYINPASILEKVSESL